MNHCKLTLTLEFKSIDNSTMEVMIQCGDNRTTINPGQSVTLDYDVDITLPTCLTLKFSGKDLSKDTLVDSNGKITADKCVIVQDIKLDNISVSNPWLKKHLVLIKDSGETVNSNYIGFNGTLNLNFKYNDAFLQLMLLKRQEF